VTIEGVERVSQLGFLAGSGDVDVQGFLVARPMDADAVLESVERIAQVMHALLDPPLREPFPP